MVSRTFILDNRVGLHLRPASTLVGVANKYQCHVMMRHSGHLMNCKSLMGVLAFPVAPGEEITIECDGTDEEEALERVVGLLQNEI